MRRVLFHGSRRINTSLLRPAVSAHGFSRAFSVIKENVIKENELFTEAQGMWHIRKPQAFLKLKEAASLGHAAATIIVGDTYMDGDKDLSVKVDEQKAYEHYKTAAASQYTPAYLKVARCYLEGRGAEQNNHRAAEFLELGAAAGDPDAQAYLGNFYYSGAAAPKDPSKAAELYLAAMKNTECTQREQAERSLFRTANYLYQADDSDFKPDPNRAFQIFNEMLPHTTAPIKGQCLFMIASAYAEGKGAEEDDDKSWEYLQLSAKEGCEQATETIESYMQEYPDDVIIKA